MSLKPLFVACALTLVGHRASAQLFWDGPNTTGDGILNGQSGSWNLTDPFWATDNTDTTHVPWTNGNGAVFTTTASPGSPITITVDAAIDATSISFAATTTNFVIAAGSGTLTLTGTVPIDVASGVSATISAPIGDGATPGSLTKTGAGTLTLSGTNTYTGNTTLSNGGLFLDSVVAVGSGTTNALGPSGTLIITSSDGPTVIGTHIEPSDGFGGVVSTGVVLPNHVLVQGNFSVATNVDPFSPGAQNFSFGGTVDLNGGNPTITGLTAQGQVHFSNVISNGAITLSDASGVYTAFIYDGPVANTYTGLTTVNANAFLVLDQFGVVNGAVVGDILVNPGGSAELFGTSNQIATTSSITVNSTGINLSGLQIQGFELRNGVQTITNLFGNGTVGLGSGTLTLSGGNFSGDIIDGDFGIGGNIVKNSSSTLVLSGVNTYSGVTLLNAGVIQAGSSTGFSPNSAFTVATGATLDVNGFNPTVGSLAGNGTVTNTSATAGTLITGFDGTDTTFTGSLQDGAGPLGLLKTGGGIFTITNSTYSGATTVLQGTLRAGSTTAFSSRSSYEVDGTGVIDLNGFNNSTGSLNGTGTVTNVGATPAVLTTGLDGTVGIFGGTLQDGNSTTALVKTGSGGLMLTSPNTYSGGTVLQGGALAIGSPFALGRGNLTVTGGNLQAIGATQDIQVGGNYKQTGGELDLRIGGVTEGTFDRLAVVGAANVGGRLNVTSTNGFIPARGTSLTVVVADKGVFGKFDQLTGDLATNPFLKLSVEYLPDEVVLEFGGTNFSTIIDLTPNQRAVAAAIDNMTINAKSNRALNFIDTLPLASLPAAFDRIAPEEYGTIFQMSRSAAKMIATSVENRLDAVHATHAPNGAGGPDGPADAKSANGPGQPDTPIGVFANANGEFVRVGDSSNSAGYNFDSGGVTFGADYRFNENFVAGALFNYTRTRADLVDNGRIDADSFRGGVYASLFGGGYYVNGFLGAGYNDYDVRRAGLDATVRGNTSGGEFNGLIQTGYDKHVGALTFGPVASFQYTYIGMSSLDEQGSLAPLHVSSSKGESIRTNVGFRTSYDWHIGHFILSPEIRATYQHEFGDNNDQTTANFLFGSPNFTVTSSPIGRDSLLLNVGFTLTINPQVSAYVFYDGEVGRTNYQDNNILVGVRANF